MNFNTILIFMQNITLLVSICPECISRMTLDPCLNNCICLGVSLLFLRGSLDPGNWHRSLCAWARQDGVPCLLRGQRGPRVCTDSVVLLQGADVSVSVHSGGYHKTPDWVANKQQKLISHSSGGWESKIMVPAELVSGETPFLVHSCFPTCCFLT